jgi:hypothetical protein
MRSEVIAHTAIRWPGLPSGFIAVGASVLSVNKHTTVVNQPQHGRTDSPVLTLRPKLFALVFLLCALPAFAQEQPPKLDWKPYAAIVASQGADFGSTLYAVHHGSIEAVLPSSDVVPLLLVKSATGLLMAYYVHNLQTTGHPKAARITAYVCSSFVFTVAWHNMSTAR